MLPRSWVYVILLVHSCTSQKGNTSIESKAKLQPSVLFKLRLYHLLYCPPKLWRSYDPPGMGR